MCCWINLITSIEVTSGKYCSERKPCIEFQFQVDYCIQNFSPYPGEFVNSIAFFSLLFYVYLMIPQGMWNHLLQLVHRPLWKSIRKLEWADNRIFLDRNFFFFNVVWKSFQYCLNLRLAEFSNYISGLWQIKNTSYFINRVQSKHSCLLDFFLIIWKLKYIHQ